MIGIKMVVNRVTRYIRVVSLAHRAELGLLTLLAVAEVIGEGGVFVGVGRDCVRLCLILTMAVLATVLRMAVGTPVAAVLALHVQRVVDIGIVSRRTVGHTSCE